MARLGAERVAGCGCCECARSVPHTGKVSVVGWDRIIVDFDGIRICTYYRSPTQDNKFDERGQYGSVSGGEEGRGGEGRGRKDGERQVDAGGPESGSELGGADGQAGHGERHKFGVGGYGHAERGSDDCRVGARDEDRGISRGSVGDGDSNSGGRSHVEGGRGRSERGDREGRRGRWGRIWRGRRRRRGDRKGDDAGIVGAIPEIACEGVDDEVDSVTERDGEGGGGVIFVAAA